jgi:glycosyltransferase involved in cell wall biosynthesis/O-antigen/teichoic acid export membrane protein
MSAPADSPAQAQEASPPSPTHVGDQAGGHGPWSDLRRRARSGLLGRGAWSFVVAAGGISVSNFVFHVVISRLLGANHYGVLGALLNIISVLAVPLAAVQLAVTQSVVARRASSGTVSLRAMSGKGLLGGLGAMAALWACLPLIDSFLHISSPGPILVLGLWIPLAVVGAVLQGALMGEFRFVPVAVATFVGTGVLRLVVGAVVVLAGFGVTGAIAATVVGQGVATAILLFVCRREVLARRGSSVRASLRDTALSVGALGGFTTLAGLDTFLGRHYLAPGAAGQFAAAAVAGNIAMFVPGAIVSVAFPRLVSSGGAGVAGRKTLLEGLGLVTLLGVGAASVLALTSGSVVGVLFGPRYAAAAGIVGLQGFASAFLGVAALLVYLHLARRSVAALLSWFGVVLVVLLISGFHANMEAVAVATLVANAGALLALALPAARTLMLPRAEGRVAGADSAAISAQNASLESGVRALPETVCHRQKRILVFNWRDLAHPRAGGAEVYTHSIAKAWIATGHEVTLFCAEVRGRPDTEEVDGIRIIRRGGRLGVYREARRFWKREGDGQFDLVVDEVNTRPFLCPRFVRGTPVVALIHQVAKEVWGYEASLPVALLGRYWLEPRWLRSYGGVPVVTVSESSRASLEGYGIRHAVVVPQGLEQPALPQAAKESVPTVVFVGRLSPCKRPLDALAAFDQLRRRCPSAQLWVVGTGPMEGQVRRAAKESVTVFGRVDDARKRELMARAHVLVATSVREGWGLSVSEAAALGTAAVGYDVPGLRDSISACGGTLVPGGDTAGLAAAIEAALAAATEPLLPSHGVAPWAEVARRLLAVADEAAPGGESAQTDPDWLVKVGTRSGEINLGGDT